MPAGTSWATFNQARRDGITRTTQALHTLFTTRQQDLGPAVRAASPFTGLPEPFLGALRDLGLDDLELAHVRRWPNDQKEDVRKAVQDAIDASHSVRFVWKLHNGAKERTTIRPNGPNAITITFFSPWSKVRPTGPNDVTVDV